ncbi:MAG: DedA family protein [Magnetococcales bacterium]|nr:DedA family protein [Magnetococcales bacterium]
MPDTTLLGLCLNAFLAATLLPIPSELWFSAVLMEQTQSPFLPWMSVTVGNVAGSVVNWLLGRFAIGFQNRPWFPIAPDTLDTARQRLARHGPWWLLLAWVPVIGDPLTFAAGILRVPFFPFLSLVAIGKGGRYLAIILLLSR